MIWNHDMNYKKNVAFVADVLHTTTDKSRCFFLVRGSILWKKILTDGFLRF